MHSGGISIWFFIGIALVVNGALITAAGVYEFLVPPDHPVVLFHLHANLWWGALLLIVGIIYCYHFAPSRSTHADTTQRRQADQLGTR